MKLTTVGFQFGQGKWAFYVPLMLIPFAFPVATAQCSQATRPEVAPSAPSVNSAQTSPPATQGDPSSSLFETGSAVRFATDRAITVLENTQLQVVNNIPISSRTTKAGARLSFTVTRDVVAEGILVIPCGATVYGTIVSAKQAGRLTGASNLTLQLTELTLAGKSYPLYTPPFRVTGQSKTRPTVEKIATGAAVGALAMDIEIGTSNHANLTRQPGPRALSDGMAAGLGAGVGAAIAAGSPPSIALIPAESQMEFTLASPIAVFPVDQRTAARLAQGLHQGGPALYVRGENQ